MADVPVLVAVTGAWEAPLVGALERTRTGLVVVRRCADVADLLAAASTGRARAALVSADLHRFDRAAVARLRSAGVVVVGITSPVALREQETRLHALGVAVVAPADASPADLAGWVREAVAHGSPEPAAARRRDAGAAAPAATGTGPAEDGGRSHQDAEVADPGAALHDPPQEEGAGAGADDLLADPEPGARGLLVAVWGPAGSPGRTTVATTLATELAATGLEVLLVDADTHAASVAQVLGLLDEAPGVAAVCRAAGAGTLSPRSLLRSAVEVGPRLRLLTGITRSNRWPEVSAVALERVWELARTAVPWTVVDLAAPLEADEEISYDTAAPRRNGAALATLAAADVVVVVGAADPVGLQRLVRALAELSATVPGAPPPRVVVTRARASAVGSPPAQRVREALRRFAGVDDVLVVPDDRAALDAALLAGRTLTEHAPGSPARAQLAALAGELLGDPAAVPATVPAGRRRGARRRRHHA